jgi:hypothetical protein
MALETRLPEAHPSLLSMTTVTFEAPEAALATIDEIAANMETDRATLLRDAVSMYLADYEQEKLKSRGPSVKLPPGTSRHRTKWKPSLKRASGVLKLPDATSLVS